ncbi:hypothetical protein GN956_G13234 [Arapaima gigas]
MDRGPAGEEQDGGRPGEQHRPGGRSGGRRAPSGALHRVRGRANDRLSAARGKATPVGAVPVPAAGAATDGAFRTLVEDRGEQDRGPEYLH